MRGHRLKYIYQSASILQSGQSPEQQADNNNDHQQQGEPEPDRVGPVWLVRSGKDPEGCIEDGEDDFHDKFALIWPDQPRLSMQGSTEGSKQFLMFLLYSWSGDALPLCIPYDSYA